MTTQLALFEAPARQDGWIYYGTDGHDIKIGYSTLPARRGGELKLTMLHTMPGSLEDERAHHRRWARHRIQGTEWFRADPAILEYLDGLVLHGTHARATLRMLIFRRAAA